MMRREKRVKIRTSGGEEREEKREEMKMRAINPTFGRKR
jgi:hypothetical protein